MPVNQHYPVNHSVQNYSDAPNVTPAYPGTLRGYRKFEFRGGELESPNRPYIWNNETNRARCDKMYIETAHSRECDRCAESIKTVSNVSAPAWLPLEQKQYSGWLNVMCWHEAEHLGATIWVSPSPGTYQVAKPKNVLVVYDSVRVHQDTQIPVKECGCGFYACYHPSILSRAPGVTAFPDFGRSDSGLIDGVIEASGTIVPGTAGFRTEKANVVALTTSFSELRDVFPDVQFFNHPQDMHEAFPPQPPSFLSNEAFLSYKEIMDDVTERT